MNELLTALVAAAKAGLDAPRCPFCTDGLRVIHSPEDATFLRPSEELPCSTCHNTGLDASDPERLIGRAESWLLARGLDIKVTWRTLDVFTLADPDGYHEQHDSTPAGLAIALLRLVARVGGAA